MCMCVCVIRSRGGHPDGRPLTSRKRIRAGEVEQRGEEGTPRLHGRPAPHDVPCQSKANGPAHLLAEPRPFAAGAPPIGCELGDEQGRRHEGTALAQGSKVRAGSAQVDKQQTHKNSIKHLLSKYCLIFRFSV